MAHAFSPSPGSHSWVCPARGSEACSERRGDSTTTRGHNHCHGCLLTKETGISTFFSPESKISYTYAAEKSGEARRRR